MRGKTADFLSISIEHFKMHLFTALARESYTSITDEVRMHVGRILCHPHLGVDF